MKLENEGLFVEGEVAQLDVADWEWEEALTEQQMTYLLFSSAVWKEKKEENPD